MNELDAILMVALMWVAAIFMLGQLLGPNPGQGARTDLEDNSAHAQSGLTYERIKDFRRYFGWRARRVPAYGDSSRSTGR